MIRSMTGYGKATAVVASATAGATAVAGSKTISVEVRSLNSKQLDLSVKTPSAYRSMEYELRALAAETVGRGKVDMYVSTEEGASDSVAVNGELFGAYYRQIEAAAREVMGGSFEAGDGVVAAILRLPDVMTSSEVGGDVSEAEKAALMSALREALAAFDKFRMDEGAVLLADILARVAGIEELLRQVEPFEKARIGAVRERILENVASLGVVVDNNRLEQEIVFWVEKLDITEEKVRLAKHCDYFREVTGSGSGSGSGSGRKLGFIAQEMGREINTLGSKANDAEIQRIVVQMKDELEKIKEQLLNIL